MPLKKAPCCIQIVLKGRAAMRDRAQVVADIIKTSNPVDKPVIEAAQKMEGGQRVVVIQACGGDLAKAAEGILRTGPPTDFSPSVVFRNIKERLERRFPAPGAFKIRGACSCR